MKNTIKAKQKRTIFVCILLSVLLLAGSVFVIVDSLIHMNDVYKNFEDEGFATAYAQALGLDSVRDLTQEDLDKVEVLMYSVEVGHNQDAKKEASTTHTKALFSSPYKLLQRFVYICLSSAQMAYSAYFTANEIFETSRP